LKPPHAILIIATRQIGDVLLVTPLLHSLRHAWPHACIDILVNRHKGGMLEGNPDCNRIIEISEHPSWAEYRTLLPNLFRKYDLSINTLAGDRPHLYALCSAPKRIGTIAEINWNSLWKRWINHHWTILDNRNTHTVLQNMTLASAIGVQPNYALTPPYHPGADQQLHTLLPFDWQQVTYAILHPSPMWRYKQWNENGWSAVIVYLLNHVGHIILTGGNGAEERRFLTRFTQQAPDRVHSLAGQLSFATTSRLLRSTSIFVGPDTAMTHLAAACDAPTVAIYGPSNPVKWGPWPINQGNSNPWSRIERPFQRKGNVILLQGAQPEDRAPCVPCTEEGCDQHKQSHSDCLLQLTAEQVLKAIQTLL